MIHSIRVYNPRYSSNGALCVFIVYMMISHRMFMHVESYSCIRYHTIIHIESYIM
ncbi:hypothetical protein Hanom_Chr11g00968341 [Helianthus anomalus]